MNAGDREGRAARAELLRGGAAPAVEEEERERVRRIATEAHAAFRPFVLLDCHATLCRKLEIAP